LAAMKYTVFLGSMHPPIKWLPGGSYTEGKAAVTWSWKVTSI